mgnify:CR=1 FL=1
MKKLSGIVTIALLTVLLVSCGLGGGREISLIPVENGDEFQYIDKEGKIREHNLLESRLNGVLTPGDMLTRWIKRLTREEEIATKPSAMDSLMDAVSWVRSMQTRK